MRSPAAAAGSTCLPLSRAVLPPSAALGTLLLTGFASWIKEPPRHQAEIVPQLSVWAYGISGYVNKHCFRTAGRTTFLPEFQSVRHGCECVSESSLGVPWEGSVFWGSPGKARANTIYHGASTRHPACGFSETRDPVALCFLWLSASGPQALLVVESSASRVGGEAAWENGGWGKRHRKWRSQEVETCLSGRADIWYLGVRPCSFLHLWDFTLRSYVGPGKEVTIREEVLRSNHVGGGGCEMEKGWN